MGDQKGTLENFVTDPYVVFFTQAPRRVSSQVKNTVCNS
jgi:hypothetical protein